MKYFVPMLLFLLLLPVPVCATELSAPTVPASAEDKMPEETTSFADGVMELLQKGLHALVSDIRSASQTCISVLLAVMAVGILENISSGIKQTAQMAGTACVAATLMMNTNSMIRLGAQTITEMTEYGKLFYPVMTAALAAQGGVTTSAGLYAGTMGFITILTSLLSRYFLPLVCLFLALGTAGSAITEPYLSKMKDLVKQGIIWCLKTLLTIFTSYMTITGVVSGTTDAAALKAAKVTLSSFVPVVGGILSDASESVLVSAAVAKNAAGIYGLLAILAVFLTPFLRIGLQYCILKLSAAICELLGPKNLSGLVDDFSSAMGLILGMTGSVCLLLLISTICFMKGAL